MHKLLRLLKNSIGDELGRLSTLKENLAQMPPCPTPADRSHSVGFRDVVAWHQWASQRYENHGEVPGMVRGWKHTRWGYDSRSLPLLVDFGLTSKIDEWRCDIQDVHGLGASKSNLSDFTSLDDLVETNSREMIRSIDQAGLDKNLAHDEIRILKGPDNGDFFSRCQWDGRVYLLNSGGSHHFSAARYIAKRIDVAVPLEGRLYEHALNPGVVRDVTARFEILATPEGWPPYPCLHELLWANNTSYYWKMLPRPWNTFRAYFLPKSEPRTLRIAGLLKDKGVFDVGAHLSALLRQQYSYQERNNVEIRLGFTGGISTRERPYSVDAQ